MNQDDATSLISNRSALRNLIRDEGFLMMRGLLPPATIHDVGQKCLAVIRSAGLPVGSADDPYRFDWDRMPDDYHDRVGEVFTELYGLEAVHLLYHSEPLLSVGQILTNEEDTIPHPHKRVRFQPPGRAGAPPQKTGAHQDHMYNQASTEMYTVWVPLGDVEADMGGLEVLPRSHLNGLKEVDEETEAGSITYQVKERWPDRDWFRPAYNAGDCIIFHSLTLHRASPNMSERVRLSVDCRYQGASQPFARELLQPLPGVIESYPNWRHKELQYYWERINLITVPWEPDRIPGVRAKTS